MKQIFFIVITLLCVTNTTAQCFAGETLVCPRFYKDTSFSVSRTCNAVHGRLHLSRASAFINGYFSYSKHRVYAFTKRNITTTFVLGRYNLPSTKVASWATAKTCNNRAEAC